MALASTRRGVPRAARLQARGRAVRRAAAGGEGAAGGATDTTEAAEEEGGVVAAPEQAALPPGPPQPELRTGGRAPQRFAVAEGTLAATAGASLPFVLRAATGVFPVGYKVELVPDDPNVYSFQHGLPGGRMVKETCTTASLPRPQAPVRLYEFEGCPFCRKVREAVSILDLDVLYLPCPQGGTVYRPEAKERGAKAFPYMVDENTGAEFGESDDIISYLFSQYGGGEPVPASLALPVGLTGIMNGLGLIGRLGAGSRYRKAKMPEQPLKLWAYEPSPFCKLVREVLCELELPHVQYSTPRGSAKRDELFARRGLFQAPYLEDPNTNVAMFESSEIIKYLTETYAA